MEARARKLEVQVLIAALAALVIPAAAFAQGDTASGQVRVNGVSFALRYVYVSTQAGFFDRDTEDTRLLFVDVPLSEAQRSDPFGPARLARDGKLHGVEVILNARGEPLGGAVFLDAFNGMASVSGMHQFEKTRLAHRSIAGRLFTDGPRTFAGITWDYDVTFTAAIPRPPTAGEVAAALESPPALAARAHLAAMRRGLDPFVATLTRASAESFRGPGAQSRLDALVRETPADTHLVALVRHDDRTATATVQGHRGDIVIESTLRLRLEDGLWKIEG